MPSALATYGAFSCMAEKRTHCEPFTWQSRFVWIDNQYRSFNYAHSPPRGSKDPERSHVIKLLRRFDVKTNPIKMVVELDIPGQSDIMLKFATEKDLNGFTRALAKTPCQRTSPYKPLISQSSVGEKALKTTEADTSEQTLVNQRKSLRKSKSALVNGASRERVRRSKSKPPRVVKKTASSNGSVKSAPTSMHKKISVTIEENAFIAGIRKLQQGGSDSDDSTFEFLKQLEKEADEEEANLSSTGLSPKVMRTCDTVPYSSGFLGECSGTVSLSQHKNDSDEIHTRSTKSANDSGPLKPCPDGEDVDGVDGVRTPKVATEKDRPAVSPNRKSIKQLETQATKNRWSFLRGAR